MPTPQPMNALDEAKAMLDLPLREDADPIDHNSDREGIIAGMLEEVGVEPGSSWCAAFVSHCFKAATGRPAPFASGGSQAIKTWFREHGRLSENAQDVAKWKGALFVWTDADQIHGHIGFVSARMTIANSDGSFSGPKLISIETIEGNSSSGGGSDLDGVWSHRRSVPSSCGHRLFYCNTTDMAGGDWW